MQYYELEQKAFQEITNHKIKVERVADENLINALKIKEIKILYDEIKDKKRSLAEKTKTPKESQKINNCIVSDRKKLSKLFSDNNLDIMEVVPKYWCKNCRDSGMMGNKFCDCVKNMTSKMFIEDESQSKNASFDNADFSVFDNSESMKNIYNKAKEFIDKQDTTKYKNFTILGGVGVGKTYLMKCMTNYAISLNKNVIYLSAFRLNQTFLKYYTAPMQEKNNILQPLIDCDVLSIDDLGCEQILNNVTIPMLIMLINERNSAFKTTILTSNLSLDEIRERYDYRLCSRLLDKDISITIELVGNDLRQKIKSK